MHAHAGHDPVDAGWSRRKFGPADIAAATFRMVRRGLDPHQVHGFLRAVADEVAALHRVIAAKDDEIQVHKDALRQWQSELGPTNTADGYLTRTGRAAVPRPLRTTDTVTDEWPAVQPPYGHPTNPEQP